MAKEKEVLITAPNMKKALYVIRGSASLVIHRFSHKTMIQMRQKMEAGSTTTKGKKREPVDLDQLYNEARYISREGWDGMNAASIRNAMIGACRLVGFKMTHAKMSLFVEADGVDAKEPEIQLVKIVGKPRRYESIARVETGQPYVCVRPSYDKWEMVIRILYDADQFTLEDVTNLLSRVGMQCGIGEGRPSSPNSAGMGWGTFTILNKKETKNEKIAS